MANAPKQPSGTSLARRDLLSRLSSLVLPFLPAERAMAASTATDPAWQLTEAQWRKRLSPAAFQILRREGTEPAFSSPLNGEKRRGTFHCAGCDLPLFSSRAKYDSGTGWPSFWQPLSQAVTTKVDFRLLVPRKEYHCRRCGGHQGHVFGDGPPPTGQRYCNNGLALRFQPD